ncbi:MAG TPA: hypothetical protein VF218_09075 [Acidothermaceae bacterium]
MATPPHAERAALTSRRSCWCASRRRETAGAAVMVGLLADPASEQQLGDNDKETIELLGLVGR